MVQQQMGTFTTKKLIGRQITLANGIDESKSVIVCAERKMRHNTQTTSKCRKYNLL